MACMRYSQPSRSHIVCGLAVAVLIGFLIPRPTFVDNVLGFRDSEFVGTTLSTASSSDATTRSPLIQVDFYGESLCPDCRHMVLDILEPMFKNGLSDLISLRYIAYGNVRNNACQHGPAECLYNRYINCAQDAVDNDQNKWFPYVACLAQNLGDIAKRAGLCAEDNGFGADDLTSCAEGDVGASLEAKAAEETNGLSPKHTFVPWIVVNGVALGADFENLDRYICALAPEKQRPEVCYELRPELRVQGG